jgi:hypothetical protein
MEASALQEWSKTIRDGRVVVGKEKGGSVG